MRCRATLAVLTAADGGRVSAIQSGYQGRFQPDIDDENVQNDYFAVTETSGPISPGAEGDVVIRVGINGVVPEIWVGLGFGLREGGRVVARGRVTKVLGSVDEGRC